MIGITNLVQKLFEIYLKIYGIFQYSYFYDYPSKKAIALNPEYYTFLQIDEKLLLASTTKTTINPYENTTYSMKRLLKASEWSSVTRINISNCVRSYIAFIRCSILLILSLIFLEPINLHALCKMGLLQARENTPHFFNSTRYLIHSNVHNILPNLYVLTNAFIQELHSNT